MSKSALEEKFALQVKALKLPEPVREHEFCERKWRIDFAWPDIKVAVEIEGGIWSGGRHNRGSGYLKDMEKYNRISAMGWMLFRFDGGSVKSGVAIRQVEDFIRHKIKEIK